MPCSKALFLLAVAAVYLPPLRAANIVSNPGFENGLTGWTNASSHGWTVAAAANVEFGTYDAANGAGTGDCSGTGGCLNPATGAYIYQNLTTIVGQEYTLSFYYYFSGSSGLQEIDAYFGATEAAAISVTSNSPSWILSTTTVTATATTMKLEFVEGNDPATTYLDNVSVDASSSTPEPATWVTFAGGMLFLLLAPQTAYLRAARSSSGTSSGTAVSASFSSYSSETKPL